MGCDRATALAATIERTNALGRSFQDVRAALPDTGVTLDADLDRWLDRLEAWMANMTRYHDAPRYSIP
jgi:hypothetical protein